MLEGSDLQGIFLLRQADERHGEVEVDRPFHQERSGETLELWKDPLSRLPQGVRYEEDADAPTPCARSAPVALVRQSSVEAEKGRVRSQLEASSSMMANAAGSASLKTTRLGRLQYDQVAACLPPLSHTHQFRLITHH